MDLFLLFFLWVLLLVFLSVIGVTCGVRKLYVATLLKIFDLVREHLKVSIKRKFDTDHGLKADEAIERSVVHSPNEVKFIDTQFDVDGVHPFQMSDVFPFCVNAVEAIVQDGCTSRFSAEELVSWNLLTRTENRPEFISMKMEVIWFLGFIFRYFILFPVRLILFLFCLTSIVLGNFLIPKVFTKKEYKRISYTILMESANRVLMRAFSSVIRYHNRENRAKGGGICVANHTSPIDIFVLGSDNTYALVGQKQPGFFGFIQDTFDKAESHVWFNRAEVKDREGVSRRLKEHVDDKSKLPILIFPEGTCVNNTSVMMFKKGSFETGGLIYPAAIKYDSRFADPFWNSSECNVLVHVFRIMTSWALVCDVWYMPPQVIGVNESSIEFANRVKADIARQGGLVDLEWDGMLKRSRPSNKIIDKAKRNYSFKLSAEK